MPRNYTTETLQSGATATGNGVQFDVIHPAMGLLDSIHVQVTGITTATVQPEASMDGTNWVGVYTINISNNTGGNSITANGIYKVLPLEARYFRARISAYTSGTITVQITAVAYA